MNIYYSNVHDISMISSRIVKNKIFMACNVCVPLNVCVMCEVGLLKDMACIYMYVYIYIYSQTDEYIGFNAITKRLLIIS